MAGPVNLSQQANTVAMDLAKKAEEDSRKNEAAKEAAAKKEEADKIRRAEMEKKEFEAVAANAKQQEADAKKGSGSPENPPTEGGKAASGEGDKPQDTKSAKEKKLAGKDKFQKSHPAKIRVGLPPIDSYEKELEYIPDVSGRILARLQRLMGTERVRITDTKYLKNLQKQLEGEEQIIWGKRAKQRQLAEKNRFRQLAIEGHMEPGPDMQDLYQHPVFRVNRILNRLSNFDTKINLAPNKKLPPITPVEPFSDYERTGKLFDFHPDHYLRVQSLNEEAWYDEMESVQDESLLEEGSVAGLRIESSVIRPDSYLENRVLDESRRDLLRRDEWGGEDDGWEEYLETGDLEEEEEEEEEETLPIIDPEEEKRRRDCEIELLGRGSLTDAKGKYGIGVEEDLAAEWKPYQSHLIHQVYQDETEGEAEVQEGEASDMYDFANAVLGTYKREMMKADNFMLKGLKKF